MNHHHSTVYVVVGRRASGVGCRSRWVVSYRVRVPVRYWMGSSQKHRRFFVLFYLSGVCTFHSLWRAWFFACSRTLHREKARWTHNLFLNYQG
jgi:hypothetical protein